MFQWQKMAQQVRNIHYAGEMCCRIVKSKFKFLSVDWVVTNGVRMFLNSS